MFKDVSSKKFFFFFLKNKNDFIEIFFHKNILVQLSITTIFLSLKLQN